MYNSNLRKQSSPLYSLYNLHCILIAEYDIAKMDKHQLKYYFYSTPAKTLKTHTHTALSEGTGSVCFELQTPTFKMVDATKGKLSKDGEDDGEKINVVLLSSPTPPAK